MNKTTKMLVVFLTAGFFSWLRTKKRVQNLLLNRPLKLQLNHPLKRRQKSHQLMKAKKEDALAGAQKTVLETSDEAGKSTHHLVLQGRYLVITRKS